MASNIDRIVSNFGPIRFSKKTLDFLDKNAPDRCKIGVCKFKGMKRQKQIMKAVERAALMTAWIEWANGGVLEEY